MGSSCSSDAGARGCCATSPRAGHGPELLVELICKTDSLAGAQVLRRDVPGFISIEQITGVLGKGKEVSLLIAFIGFFLEGISQRTAPRHPEELSGYTSAHTGTGCWGFLHRYVRKLRV